VATSTFPAAKASILALLKAAPGLAAATVDYGDPGVSRLQRLHVFLGGTSPDGQTWAPFGRLQRDEQYGIQFWVHFAAPGSTQQEATEGAHALFGVVESTIRPLARTATQIAAGMYGIDVQPSAVTEFTTDEGHACLIDGVIFCKARI
jgi:hypothetical protein